MKALKLGVAGLLALLVFVPIVYANIFDNSQGTGNAPVSVGTSTPVMILGPVPRRNKYSFKAETAQLRCRPGLPNSTVVPTPAPDQTHGYLMNAGTDYNEDNFGVDLGTNQALWCVAIGSSGTNVDTWEMYQPVANQPFP